MSEPVERDESGTVSGEFTLTELAEILVMIRKKLLKVFAIIVAVWFISFAFIADPLVLKIKHDLLPKGAELIYRTPLEGFMLKMKISLALGIVAAIPYVLYIAYRTLKERTDLLKNFEFTRGQFVKYGVASVLLFIAGVAYGYIIMLPIFMKFLFNMAQSEGVLSYYTISDFIMFVVKMLLVFGIVFQMPLIMILLVGNGIVKYSTVKYYWRHVVVAIFTIAAIITPPDVLTQLMVAGPMVTFFGIGLAITKLVYRNKIKQEMEMEKRAVKVAEIHG